MSPAFFPHRLVALGAALLLSTTAPAQENAYDLFSKVLNPYLQVIAGGDRAKNHAVQVILQIEQTGREVPALKGTYVTFALQMPDCLRITAPVAGETITICRHGDELWAHPASRLRVLLENSAFTDQLPKSDKSFRLDPFQLPVNEKQLAFLPVLFRIKEAPSEPVDDVPCRVLELQLQKELAKSLEVEKSSARLWVASDLTPMRVAVKGQQGEATLRIQKVKFSPELAPQAWEPTAEQAGDTMKVPPQLYDRLVRAIMGRGSNAK